MSKDTLQTKVALLENNQDNIMEKLEKLNEAQEKTIVVVTELKETIIVLPEKLTEKFDERYASKELESTMKKINWLLILAIVSAVLALVIKQ